MVEAYEIDFLPVGEGEHSGDAIAMRWTQDGQNKVLIYDGGTSEYGKALVTHVKTHFNTDRVDYVVNSHPDNDHAAGLVYVLENLNVGEVWMHKPWDHSATIRQYFHDGRITHESLKERLQKKMSAAHAVQKAAERQGIPIYEPFAGLQIGIFTVLSPTRERYIHELVPKFEKTPELKKEAGIGLQSIWEKALDTAQGALSYVAAAWNQEILPDNVSTSAENESSTILFANTSGGGILFTGDAGIDSLKAAATFANSCGINLAQQVKFVQIPHHGGRHNVSTAALDLIIGGAIPHGREQTKSAFVSAAKAAPHHPKRVVTNAFNRRGFKVAETKGRSICHYYKFPVREAWTALSYVPFFEEEEK